MDGRLWLRPAPPSWQVLFNIESRVPMRFDQRLVLACAAVAAIAAGLLGCGSSSSPKSNTPGFETTVVIGDSLSAGFQNGSLLDSQQPNGFASLIAKQGGFNLVLPLIAPPGAPAVLQLVSLGPPPVIEPMSGTSPGRENPNAQNFDVAVPGHTLNDLINTAPVLVPTSGQDLLTSAVLALPLSVPRMSCGRDFPEAHGAVLWIGNNDALNAALREHPKQ
jgi:hypothetical protein